MALIRGATSGSDSSLLNYGIDVNKVKGPLHLATSNRTNSQQQLLKESNLIYSGQVRALSSFTIQKNYVDLIY